MRTLEKINKSSDLPAKVAYRFYRMSKELDERSLAFHSVRTKLLEKYGTKDAKSGNYQVEGENLVVFQKEFADLLDEEFELNVEPFKYIEGLRLSPAEMFAVENLFDYSDLD